MERNKPVYICWMEEGDLDRTFAVEGETIPTYWHQEIPARIISRALAYDGWRRLPKGRMPSYADADLSKAGTIFANTLSGGGSGWLTTEEIYFLLATLKLPLAPGSLVTSVEDAVKLARATDAVRRC